MASNVLIIQMSVSLLHLVLHLIFNFFNDSLIERHVTEMHSCIKVHSYVSCCYKTLEYVYPLIHVSLACHADFTSLLVLY